ncbi:MAG: hypothetical protein ABSF80_01375 [Chitinispirillaceae bacterium]|jgi:nucleotidyltransferase/DNA polymerase involved in DNA repair
MLILPQNTLRAPLPRKPLFLALNFEHFSAQVIAAYDPAYSGKQYIVMSQAAADSLAVVRAQSPWVNAPSSLAGMPLHILRRRYPAVKIVPQNKEFESSARNELSRIYDRYTPTFKINDNATSLLDLSSTPAQRCGIERTIKILKHEIHDTIGLPVIAAGSGASALIAKVMAKTARPAGVMVCPAGSEEKMLATLDVRLLPGLSTGCRERLAKYGLHCAGQIRRLGRAALTDRFGAEGDLLYAMTSGNDAHVVAPPSPSLYAESVLEQDTNDTGALTIAVRVCVDRLCYELKIKEQTIDRLTVTVRYRDGKIVQKTVTFAQAIDDFLCIAKAVTKTFDALYTRRVGIRSIRLNANRPGTQTGQMSLFETPWEEKQRRVSAGITDVRRRMAFNAVFSASDVQAINEQKKEAYGS